MKETFKIKQIERMLGKRFEKFSVPSGSMICEAQLFSMINKVKNIDVDHEKIDPYLPAIFDILKDMSHEDLIKHFVSVEFNRFLEYYQNAPDLNATGRERDSRGFDRLNNSSVSSFHLNIGKADGLNPKALLQLINDNCPGKINVGKIKITETFSLVQVDKDQGDTFTRSLNNSIFVGDRQVHVRPDSKPSGDSFNKRRGRSSRGRSGDRRDNSGRRNSGRQSSRPPKRQRNRNKSGDNK
jgi:ATP-dependent RNA helicase DeaD